jgi:hypothetical protein
LKEHDEGESEINNSASREEKTMSDASSAQGSGQLNKQLGANTVQFHTAYPLPNLKCTGGSCSLPNPGAINSTGGTPNQKAERYANQIAFYHFVSPDTTRGQKAVSEAIAFFQGQAKQTGHQCVFGADEGLTPSHGPIWWRALTSLRITTAVLASRGGDYATLESSVRGWILGHFALCALGEIPSGVNAGKVLVPGSRWKNPDPKNPWFAQKVSGGSGYPKDKGLTDQVTNVVYQLIKTGSVPWTLPAGYFTLSQNKADIAGAALAKQILGSTFGFGSPATGLPGFHSELIFERYSNGHRAYFPNGMPDALKPALEGWADYESGTLCMSSIVGAHPPPPFSGDPQKTVVPAV